MGGSERSWQLESSLVFLTRPSRSQHCLQPHQLLRSLLSPRPLHPGHKLALPQRCGQPSRATDGPKALPEPLERPLVAVATPQLQRQREATPQWQRQRHQAIENPPHPRQTLTDMPLQATRLLEAHRRPRQHEGLAIQRF